MLGKTEYILKSLSKIANKRWEFFVISRIIHKLDDDEVEIVTQQLVRRPDGSRALTDLYFPQFSKHLEIDEAHHLNQLEADRLRAQDVVEVTGHEIERIRVTDDCGVEKPLHTLRAEIDRFVDCIRTAKKQSEAQRKFTPWDFEKRYSSEQWLKKGFISIDENVVFRTQIEAMRCFGFSGKGYQRGAWTIPDGTHDVVWFPRLYPHGNWENALINSGRTIQEKALDEKGRLSISKQLAAGKEYPDRKHIVFAKANDPMGFNLLRFVGSFRLDIGSAEESLLKFERVSKIEAVRIRY